MTKIRSVFLSLVALLCAAGCEEVSHRDIGDEINILIRRDDQLVPPATDRLVRYRRAAIPQIETAMHTAAPIGRHHLITALEKIGDGEAVPVLRHVAVFDITADVRASAEELLTRWAASADDKPRAARARAALADFARKRAAGIGPMVFGSAGIPGVPSTVGAPEPVGTDPQP
jgi:HEAT repeat protein